MVSPDIADALGLTQKQEGSRVQFTRNGVSTYFTGSDATFSGSEMDTVPALRDGTLYVPLAYLAQAYNMPGLLGCRFQGSLCVYHLHRPHLAGWRTGPRLCYSDANQLPMTGYFSKTLTYPNLQGNSAQREAYIYISEHASCRPYFYVIALPDKGRSHPISDGKWLVRFGGRKRRMSVCAGPRQRRLGVRGGRVAFLDCCSLLAEHACGRRGRSQRSLTKTKITGPPLASGIL